MQEERVNTAAGSDPAAKGAQVELVLRHLTALPTLSPIAARIMALSSASDAEFDEIISLIEADPSLSAKMLSMCRRSNVTAGRTITSVRRAVIHLGLEAVQSAVLGVQIYELLGQAPSSSERREANRAGEAASGAADSGGGAGHANGSGGAFDRLGFWRHSLGVACAAEAIASEHKSLKIRPDEAFTAGLVHDLGKLVLDWILPKSFGKAVQLAASRQSTMAWAERQVLGVDHHLVGKRIAEHWSLPLALQDVMWLHGTPIEALPTTPNRTLVMVVTLADALCRELHIGWSGSHDRDVTVRSWCAELGLNEESVRKLTPRLHEAVSARSRDIGLGDTPGEELVVQSLTSANEQLGRLQRVCQAKATQSRQQTRVLDVLAKFAMAAGPGQLLGDVLSDIAASFMELCQGQAGAPGAGEDAPFFAIVHQSREGAAWRVGTLDQATRELRLSETIDPAKDSDGSPISLASLHVSEDGGGLGNNLGGTIGLLTWLSEHLSQAGAGAAPDLRTLRTMALPATFGPGAVIVHDRDLSGVLGSRAAQDALLGAWARAIASAGQHDGARRLSEELAQTSRQLIEAQSRLANSQSLARLGELAAGAAHEMNNPLTVISGRAQVLAQRMIDQRDRTDVQQIAQAAGRLTELISAMHLIARPPALQAVATPIGGLLSQLCRQIRGGGNGAGTGTGPAIRVEASRVRSPVLLDVKLFARAMGEVVANALQAEPKTGVDVRVWEDELDDRLMIEVRDDGAGLSDRALRHAFDPFFSEKKAGRRSGLGLPIARSLIALHRGEMWMTSEQGKGTSVFIALRDWRANANEPTRERAA
ncbi:MAG: HDOD domain-containing protein [Phycisphaerales bacterium]|nr:HDOD domain-containing protein [Phycisphaerales bacterium]